MLPEPQARSRILSYSISPSEYRNGTLLTGPVCAQIPGEPDERRARYAIQDRAIGQHRFQVPAGQASMLARQGFGACPLAMLNGIQNGVMLFLSDGEKLRCFR